MNAPRWTALLTFIALAFPQFLTAQGLTTPTEIRSIVRRAADDVAKETGLLVEPRLIDEMSASVVIFASNFCYPPDSAEGNSRCQRTLGDARTMARVVGEFLREAVDFRPARIESVGSRLARTVSMDFSMIGWPSHIDNALGVVEVPASVRGGTLLIRTAAGQTEVGIAGRALAILPGTVELAVREGNREASSLLHVTPRSRAMAAFSHSTQGATRPLGRVEAAQEFFCYDPSTQLPSGPHAPFNWGRAMFGESPQVREANQAPFTKQHLVDIRVVDETSGRCGPECMAGLGVAFAQAIAIWRSGCERCDPNALSVVRLGQTVWVDARIHNRLQRRRSSRESVSLDLRVPDPSESLRTVSAPSLSVPRTHIVGFDNVGSDASIRETVCALAPDTAPWIVSAQGLLCAGKPRTYSNNINAIVTLKAGATSCGPARDFLACGLPNGGIEITIERARFSIPSPGGPQVLGAPTADGDPIDIRLVVLHEVGHWFGLPHAEVAGSAAHLDVMAEVLGDGKECVSAHSMSMMNNAADLRWTYRVAEGKGLRWRSPSTRLPTSR